jgi:hypothetical protein
LGISEVSTESEVKLSVICLLHWITVLGEKQETPARKAEAFKKARRQYPKRQRALEQLEKARKLRDEGNVDGAKRIEKMANRTLPHSWLPTALEQEAGRLAQSEGLTRIEAYVELEKRYRRRSVPGRRESHTLAQTIRRLQDLAWSVDRKLSWRNRTIPPRLISFLQAALMAAGIQYPSYDHNPSKFRKLMRKVRERPA